MAEKKYCPLLKRECLFEQCEWWAGKGDYAKCAIKIGDDVSYKLHLILEALKVGASGGGGSNRRGNRPQQQAPDFSEEFGEDGF